MANRVRTIPPYVRSFDDTDHDDQDFSSPPRSLTSSRGASSAPPGSASASIPTPRAAALHIPGLGRGHRGSTPGRRWDHMRTREPPIITTPFLEYGTRWRSFVGPVTGGPDVRRITPLEVERAKELLARYDRQEMEVVGGKEESGVRRRGFVRGLKRTLLRSAWVPLAFRISVLVFSALGLGLGASIFNQLATNNSRNEKGEVCKKGGSTYLAVIVDTIAILYTLFISYDEFRAPPIGVRHPAAKLRLTLLDLLFIIFGAANLSLAFQALKDPDWVCTESGDCPRHGYICGYQKSLVSVLLIALIAWLLTFIVSLCRLVYRVSDR
ncbi:hypothetical protein EJ06DRAFT_528981 [Trichodelitschia bisporula]|uniref:Uncharacterized protein n=1 Tax=Trichodelitschia bisporula TaxID=703511 RepID=A0A6G1I0J4_9PEZI|nr:hypothetical protein EJ06DRAFT_528981 [Trichodelitschia bisporula]